MRHLPFRFAVLAMFLIVGQHLLAAEPAYLTPIPSWKLKQLKPLKLAFCMDGGAVDSRERLHARVDRQVEVGATFLSFGVGSSEHAYGAYPPPQVLEAWWEGLSDEVLSADQRRDRDLCLGYYKKGTAPLTIVIERAHQQGLKVFAEFRINRYSHEPKNYRQSSFFMSIPNYSSKTRFPSGASTE